MNDIEKMLTMIEDTDNHCRIIYNEVCDILKSKGMTDEEILKTVLNLHTNSANALNGGIRSININNNRS